MAELTPRAQDYLRIIYELSSREGKVRPVTLSEALGVRMPTALQMVRSLASQGLVTYERHGEIELTEKGRDIAKELQKRHDLLLKFLTKYLGVGEEVAERDSCGIEHYLSEETYERLVKFIEFMESCPHGLPRWLEGFHFYLRWGKRPVMQAEEEAVIVPLRKLWELEPGEAGKIVMIHADPDTRLRLAEDGLIVGNSVFVQGKEGEILQLIVTGRQLRIGKDEALSIAVI